MTNVLKQLISFRGVIIINERRDDISSKNLLMNNGKISGIIDIDWMGIGDKLTYVALTNMALLTWKRRT